MTEITNTIVLAFAAVTAVTVCLCMAAIVWYADHAVTILRDHHTPRSPALRRSGTDMPDPWTGT